MNAAPTFHWFLPTSGDGREVVGWVHAKTATGDPRAVGRAPDFDYLADVARAADRLGFESVLTPTGTWCEDAWITTAALAPLTRRLKFIVAFRPDSLSPTLAAQLAAAFQQVSGGRLLLNVVTGGDDEEQRRYGDWLDHDRRYARTDEFLEHSARRVVRRAVRLRRRALSGGGGDGGTRPATAAADLPRRGVWRGRTRSPPGTPTCT